MQHEICKEGEYGIFRDNGEQIKLIALDLDRTTLDSNGRLSDRTKNAVEAAVKKGVHVVIATGRAITSLPEDVHKIDGLRYIVTANGANVEDMSVGESIYSNCIDPVALEKSLELLARYDFMYEIFIKGQPYVDKKTYEKLPEMNLSDRQKKYILSTRKPVDGLFEFARGHNELVENINLIFEDQESRSMMREAISKLENVTWTSSFDHNLEIGGATTSKAEAIRVICGRHGISEENIMACGDSPNDLEMLKAAGFPVAMGNAKDELKAIAKYITSSNDEDGVAEVIEKFVL